MQVHGATAFWIAARASAPTRCHPCHRNIDFRADKSDGEPLAVHDGVSGIGLSSAVKNDTVKFAKLRKVMGPNWTGDYDAEEFASLLAWVDNVPSFDLGRADVFLAGHLSPASEGTSPSVLGLPSESFGASPSNELLSSFQGMRGDAPGSFRPILPSSLTARSEIASPFSPTASTGSAASIPSLEALLRGHPQHATPLPQPSSECHTSPLAQPLVQMKAGPNRSWCLVHTKPRVVGTNQVKAGPSRPACVDGEQTAPHVLAQMMITVRSSQLTVESSCNKSRDRLRLVLETSISKSIYERWASSDDSSWQALYPYGTLDADPSSGVYTIVQRPPEIPLPDGYLFPVHTSATDRAIPLDKTEPHGAGIDLWFTLEADVPSPQPAERKGGSRHVVADPMSFPSLTQ